MKIKVDGEEKVDDMSLSESDKKILKAQEDKEQEAEKASSDKTTKNPIISSAQIKKVVEVK